MKKINLLTLAAVGLMTTSAFSIDCYLGCTKSRCKGEVNTWKQCFKECWRSNESKITNCKQGASDSGNITPEQRFIMDFFAGKTDRFPHHRD